MPVAARNEAGIRFGARRSAALVAISGDWVEVEYILLRPDERSQLVPSDTASVPYVARVRGFSLSDGEVGQPIRIKTVTGRQIEGQLKSVNPAHAPTFGRPAAALLHIGEELRALLVNG